MPDTLTEIRARDHWYDSEDPALRTPEEQPWQIARDRRALLAHIDALTAAVEAVSDAVGNMELAVSKVPTHPQYLTDALELLKERDDAVLAILRGEQ